MQKEPVFNGSVLDTSKDDKNNEPTIDVEKYDENRTTKMMTLCMYETDWGKDELSLYRDECADKYFIASQSGLCIINCPSNVDEINIEQVENAMDCFLRHYSTYGYMVFNYNGIEEQIQKVDEL